MPQQNDGRAFSYGRLHLLSATFVGFGIGWTGFLIEDLQLDVGRVSAHDFHVSALLSTSYHQTTDRRDSSSVDDNPGFMVGSWATS